MEKKGIPTVTIATTAFEEAVKAGIKGQGVAELALAVVDHPIAGHDAAGIRKKADTEFPKIMQAATGWQPAK